MHGQQQLLDELDEAFVDTEPPALIKPNGHSLEARRAAEFFSGRCWRDVTLEILRDGYPGDISACLEFLSAESGLYFLPAYLRICVVAYGESDVLPYTLERQLSESPANVSHFGRVTDRLSTAQRRVVASILSFLRDHHERDFDVSGAAVALGSGWARYLVGHA